MNRTSLIAGLVLVMGFLLSGGCLAAEQPGTAGPSRPSEPLLSVSGKGEVSARPDRATVNLGAVWQAEQAAEAQRQVNRVMQQAAQQIRGLNIPEESISTVGLSLEPVYAQPGRGQQEFEPRIVGFRARNTIRIRVDDLSKIGPVLDVGIGAGANEIQGIQFELKNDVEARREALRRAVGDARVKAETIAEALGVKLAHVAEVAEAEVGFRPPEPFFAGRMVQATIGMETPVLPGQIQVQANVTLRYRIREKAPE